MESFASFVNNTFLCEEKRTAADPNYRRACASLRVPVSLFWLASLLLFFAIPLTLAAGGYYPVFVRSFGIFPVAGVTLLLSTLFSAFLLAPYDLGLAAYAYACVTGAEEPLSYLPAFYLSPVRHRAAVLFGLGQAVRRFSVTAGLLPALLLSAQGNLLCLPAFAAWTAFLPFYFRDRARRAFLPAILVSFPQVGYAMASKMSRRIFSAHPRETMRYSLAGLPAVLLIFLTGGLATVPVYPVFLLGRARRTVHFCLRHPPGEK